MSFGVRTTLEIGGDRGLFERVSKNVRDPRKLMRRIGVLGMSSAYRRLNSVLGDDPDGLRTGTLGNSLAVGKDGPGSADTIFIVDETGVDIGTSVLYAAQVQHGGIIEPRTAKALAIPLVPELKLHGIGPRELDPNRELLRFVPYTGAKPNVFGLLVDDEQPLAGRERTMRGSTPYGPGPLYALAWWVQQDPKPFLFWSANDRRLVREELFPQWVGEKP